MSRIVAHLDRCIGAGLCVAAASKYFTQDDDDGTVIVLSAAVSDEDVDTVMEAVRVCPTQALELIAND
jgi:ferredoxin